MPLPVAVNQVNLYTASSVFGAATTGGTFSTCKCRVVKVTTGANTGFASRIGLPWGSSLAALVCGSMAGRVSKVFLKPWVPQMNTKTVRMSHGIHARITAGFASLAKVAVGTGFSSCSASIFELSTRPDRAAEVCTVAGFQTLRKPVRQAMEISAAITSTSIGP
ncbi:hypothetical protein D3C78_1449530 [compost metagenome]